MTLSYRITNDSENIQALNAGHGEILAADCERIVRLTQSVVTAL